MIIFSSRNLGETLFKCYNESNSKGGLHMSLEDKLQQATGAAKEVLGKVTGDKSTETEGAVEKGLGKAKEVLENVKEGVEGAVEGIKNTFNK